MKLTVKERIAAMNTLPTEGNYITFKIILTLRTALSFSEVEIKRYKIVIKGDLVTWDLSKKEEKDIDFGDKGKEIMCNALHDLDAKGKINDGNSSLYEKFIL
jgi:hypothetical protein